MNASSPDRIVGLGRIFFAAGILALGAQHFYNGDFVTVILPSVPMSLPGRYFWTCLAGIGLIISGSTILLGKGARAGAILLGTCLVASILLRHLPSQVPNPWPIAVWNNAFKALTLAGGAFLVAATLPREASTRWNRAFVTFGCFGLGITLAVFGVEHFMYAAFVAQLVPKWIPGPLFWTYFCGAALVAAGLGMMLGVKARLAAGLIGISIFIWFLALHIPRAIADPFSGNGNEWTSVFEALAFSGIALILSRTLPRKQG